MAPVKAPRQLLWALMLWPPLALLVAGCEPTADANPPPVRPVRTITAEKGHVGEQVVLTGQINA